MFYLQDYLESIEELPQELKEKFFDIRQHDLRVHNSAEQLEERVQRFFADAIAENLSPEQKQSSYEDLLSDWQNIMKYADEKVSIVNQMQDIMVKLIQRLDGELEKFRQELGLAAKWGNNVFANGVDGIKASNTKSSNSLSSPNDSHQHSALSAALLSATPHHQHNNSSVFNRLNLTSVHNKISLNSKSSNLADPTFVRNDPLTEAASQAIAATQQLQGRKTSSLKASFAAINNGNLESLNSFGSLQDSVESNRNALAPMAPGQQAFRYQYGNKNGIPNPLFVSVTKSGRPSKRPKHRASHLYPDESPTSISSDNSVFENSESLSSAEFTETGITFGSNSPASLDFATRGNTTLYQRYETKYCICRQISYGEMVACDNNECEIEWFHYDCVGITQPPKGKWYCPDCSLRMASQQLQHSNPPHTQKKRAKKEKLPTLGKD